LRKTLKDEGADVVETLIEQLAVTMGAVQGESWCERSDRYEVCC
jgi:hypothetical protein